VPGGGQGGEGLLGAADFHVRSFFAGAYHRTPPRASDLVFMKKIDFKSVST